MSKKACPVCGNKAGLLGFNIANEQRICSGCFGAASPHMPHKETDRWTLEEVTFAMRQGTATQGTAAQGNTQVASDDVLIVSTDFITDKNLQTISVVSGSRFVFSGVIAESDINRAIASLKRSASSLGADAVIGFRYAPSNNHAYVWGTAVKYI